MKIQIPKFSAFVLFVAVSTAAVKWVPIFGSPPGGIQASDLGVIFGVGYLLYVLSKAHVLYMPRMILAFTLSLLIFLLGRIIHGSEIGGGLSSIKSFAYLMTALALANVVSPESIDPRKLAISGFLCLSVALTYSSNIVGLSVFDEVVVFLTTFDGVRLLYGFLRPSFNAFVQGGDIVFVGSIMNEFASGASLLFALSMCAFLEKRSPVLLLIAFVCASSSIIVFSTSGIIVLLVGVTLSFLIFVKRQRTWVAWFPVVLVVLLTLSLVLPTVGSYIWAGISADDNSRSSRLWQYSVALDVFSSNPLFGGRLVSIGGHSIHNYILSLAAASGLVGLSFGFWAHYLLFRDIFRSMKSSVSNSYGAPSFMVSAAGFTSFAMPVLFGGGYGSPTSVSAIGLGLGYLFARRGRQIQKSNKFFVAPIAGVRACQACQA